MYKPGVSRGQSGLFPAGSLACTHAHAPSPVVGRFPGLFIMLSHNPFGRFGMYPVKQ